MATRKELRQMWTPKRPEMKEQCASCPFRSGNDAEFGAVIQRLVKANGEHGKVAKARVAFARFQLLEETKHMGDFICHQTAYDKDMNLRDASEHRQCPGATHHYKNEG